MTGIHYAYQSGEYGVRTYDHSDAHDKYSHDTDHSQLQGWFHRNETPPHDDDDAVSRKE